MAQLTLTPEFFTGSLAVYSRWQDAFARESLQNATDARPTRIDVRFEDAGDHGRVTFSDDGVGMSRETLENVFFALGRTTKTGPGNIGGFGRARLILCFAQRGYQIRTRNVIATGAGGEYQIMPSDTYRKGCEFVVDLVDDTVEAVRTAYTDLLDDCSVDVPVYIDGDLYRGRDMPSRAARVLRDDNSDTWGRVYVDRTGVGRLLVRVHGLLMFSRWLSTDDDIVVELSPSRSRQLLSASRDQLRAPFGDQLDEFIADLSRNRRRALRPPIEPLDMRIGGGGFLATDAVALDPAALAASASEVPVESEAVADVPGDGDVLVAVTADNAAADANAASSGFSGNMRSMAGYGLHQLGFDVYLMADENDTRVRRLTRSWNPQNWDSKARRRRNLLLTWKAAVGYTMDIFVTAHPHMQRVMWTVGWTFDRDTLATHRAVGENSHVLALNPVTDAGTARYRLSDRASRQLLLAVAAHEVCHVACPGHDERFASLLTDLFASLDPARADRLMRAAARRG